MDTLSAISYLAAFLSLTSDAGVIAANNNLLRAMAFAVNYTSSEFNQNPQEEDERPKDCKYQSWTRNSGTVAESLTRIKGLVQCRCWDRSFGVDPRRQAPGMDSESDEEIHEPSVE
eukprot:6405885-Heterocapsa_arctica.AAC.1